MPPGMMYPMGEMRGHRMSMTPGQLEQLEQALRRKWELEQQTIELDRTIKQLKEGLLGDAGQDSVPVPSVLVGRPGGGSCLQEGSLPERVVAYLKVFGYASASDIISAVAPNDGNAVRSAISRLSRKGDQIAQQTNEDGVPIRGMYVYAGGDE